MSGCRGWSTWEERRPDFAVYELPVLSSAYSPARWFIDGGMAPDDHGLHRRRKAVRELGLLGTDTIAFLLVDRAGRILAGEHGRFNDEKTTRLTAALQRSSDDA
jgi:hypothetical protein